MRGKLLFIDDEEMMLDMLRKNFEFEGYTVLTAQNAHEALQCLEQRPDLILLDINMPGTDGLTLCTQIRRHVSCPIVFLTARVDKQDAIDGLMAGGDDYITKPFCMEELLARVDAHLRREQRRGTISQVRFSGRLVVDYGGQAVYWGEERMDFSGKEFAILRFLSQNAGMVFDRETIYEKIWGLDGEGDSIVVKEHIRKIRQKLAQYTDETYIKTVWGVGYQWEKQINTWHK